MNIFVSRTTKRQKRQRIRAVISCQKRIPELFGTPRRKRAVGILHNAQVHGITDEFYGGVHIEFAVDVLAMRVHRMRTEAKKFIRDPFTMPMNSRNKALS